MQLIDDAVIMAQMVYDETMAPHTRSPSMRNGDASSIAIGSNHGFQPISAIESAIEQQAQAKAAAVFQAELAKGQAMLQYKIQLHQQGHRKIDLEAMLGGVGAKRGKKGKGERNSPKKKKPNSRCLQTMLDVRVPNHL